MLNPISTAIQTPVAAQAAKAAPEAAPTPKTQAIVVDTVQISAAAKAMQELTETSAQTAKEASGGDSQARRLLAKEAAGKAEG